MPLITALQGDKRIRSLRSAFPQNIKGGPRDLPDNIVYCIATVDSVDTIAKDTTHFSQGLVEMERVWTWQPPPCWLVPCWRALGRLPGEES